MRAIAPVLVGGLLAAPSVSQADPVRVVADLDSPSVGVFPSDLFTVSDFRQQTGRRVNLPLPDCDMRPDDCDDLGVINQLDGFNLQPRISV